MRGVHHRPLYEPCRSLYTIMTTDVFFQALIKPRLLTAWITAGGFAVWYGWAFLTINAYLY
jgi:hypothetical protein